MAKVRKATPNVRSEPALALGLSFMLILAALVLSSCNTVEGMGDDISAAGDAVSGTADDVEDEM